MRKIFGWFVVDRKSASWIAKQLSNARVEKDHRSTTKRWHVYEVLSVLRSSKYIGIWTWGLTKTVRDPVDGRTWQEPRDPHETQSWLRLFPDLQIVPAEQYEEAQRILEERAAKWAPRRDQDGRLRGRIAGGGLRHMLEGLLICAECGADLHTCGSGASYLGCSRAKNGECTNRTTLSRERAERMLIDVIAGQIRENTEWRQRIIDDTQSAHQTLITQQPSEEERIRKRIEELNKIKQRLMDAVENGAVDPDISERLKERRSELAGLERELAVIHRQQATVSNRPTDEWFASLFENLAGIVRKSDGSAWIALRELLVAPIISTPIVKPGGTRGFIRGTLRLNTGRLVVSDASVPKVECSAESVSDMVREISIDFRDVTKTEKQSQIAWQLHQQGKLGVEIAGILGVSKARGTAILQAAAKERGIELEDGRTRRSKLATKSIIPTMGQLKTNEIMELHNKGALLGDIAKEVGLDRNTVTRAVNQWRVANNLPVVDGRTRRKSLEIKSSERKSA